MSDGFESTGSSGPGPSGVPPSLGPHGEGWVAIQAVLITLVLILGLKGPRWPWPGRVVRIVLALPLACAGLALFAGGALRLGRHLTPLPKPTASGELRRDGVFSLVRHPIYGGVLLVFAGWTLVTSPLSILAFAPAIPFLELKRRREEAWLAERHADYGEYMADVRHKFVPFVW